MGDNLPGFACTICSVAEDGRTAAKTIIGHADGTHSKRDYDFVTYWTLNALEPNGSNAELAELAEKLSGSTALPTLAEVLRYLATQSTLMIVMGKPKPGHNPKHPCRRLWAQTRPENNTLFPTPRAWLPIDCDDILVPAPFGDGDQLPNAAAFIRDTLLPPEFVDVACVGAATASSGLKGPTVARIRLFFLLDQPTPLARLRKWGVAAQRAGLPIDPVIYQGGQPIFTARPIFHGMDDPVPEALRAFVVPGKAGRVNLVANRYDTISATIERKVNAAATASGDNWRKLLEATLGGPNSFFEPLSKALGLAAHSADSEADIVAFTSQLLAQRADLGRQSQYNHQWITSTLRRFRSKDVKTAQAIEFYRSKLFE